MIKIRRALWLGRWAVLGLSGLAVLPVAAQEAESAAETPPAEEVPAEARAPWKLYVGIDQDQPTLSFSDPALSARFGAQELDSRMLRLRAGVRLFEVLGIELHLGQGSDQGQAAGKFDIGSYTGLFFVPTGVLFERVEVAGILGLTRLEVERGSQSETFDGQAYGVNVELPLKLIAESLPDLRVGGGYLVYNDNNQYRTYGAHFGLRFDFEL